MKLETFVSRFHLVDAIKQPGVDQFTNVYHVMPRGKAQLDESMGEIEIKRDKNLRWNGSVISQRFDPRVRDGSIVVSMGTLEDAKLEMLTKLASIA